eukprot:gnl/MRDRNA2_/MRDRNA2_56021_c0_seq1.p1 gnl/MRDRNA2_/MRDRNA2_56021_c0~~gnl/MRDRNA2_/MRDRNA2_56021_c0_seq1.p1  ORF type:complete len:663 (+),score=119.48 gnl/MRDRNA2_/MRDRNA2_56021_c0_seq1:126-2114(+)
MTALADAAAGPLAAVGTRNAKRHASEEMPGGNNIRVAVRVRPLPATEDGIIEVEDEGVILIHKQAATGGNQFLSSQQGRTEQRAFDHVFGPQATQAQVYEQVCAPFIWPVVGEGRNATVFVYGATGAGKTHTMFGDKEEESQGIIYRAIRDLFRAMERREQMRLQPKLFCRVSLMELYNETVRDLLSSGGDGSADRICRVMEDEKKGVVKVSNLNEHQVHNSEEAMRMLRTGMNARKVEATAANSRSSRSHAMLSLTLVSGERAMRKPGMLKSDQAEVIKVHSRLCLIDLAGSERANATLNVGAALKDGAKINQSLLALANCIDALATGSSAQPRQVTGTLATPRKKPPYRDSKLTLLLKCSLSGDGLVSMVANVHPGKTHFEDSNNTLEYAKRASAVKSQTVIKPTRLSICASAPASPSRSPEARIDKENICPYYEKENTDRCISQENRHALDERSPSRLRQPKIRRPLHSRSSSNLPLRDLVAQLEKHAGPPAQKKRALEKPSRGRVPVRACSPEASSGRRSSSGPPSAKFESASPCDDRPCDDRWSPLNLSNLYDDEASAQERRIAAKNSRSRPLSNATFISLPEEAEPSIRVLAELVHNLGSEKAALVEQLETSYGERRTLEERVITLCKENTIKDQQLALLTKQLAVLKGEAVPSAK